MTSRRVGPVAFGWYGRDGWWVTAGRWVLAWEHDRNDEWVSMDVRFWGGWRRVVGPLEFGRKGRIAP